MKNFFNSFLLLPVAFIISGSIGYLIFENNFEVTKNHSHQIYQELYDVPLNSIQGKDDDPYAAAFYRYKMIVGNNTGVDPVQSRRAAIDYIEEHLSNNNSLSKTKTISWSAIGPGNIGGRIRSIVVNPSNPDQIVIGSVSGGIWKSTDGGASWNPKIDTQDPIAIGSMVLLGSTDIYAGSGEAWGNVDAVYGGGIYKSTDFGNSWSLLSSTIGSNIWAFKNVRQLAADPSGNIYAVTKAYNYKGGIGDYKLDGGLYKSSDGGNNWNKISPTDFSTNYFNGCDVIPVSSSVILFATEDNGTALGGIFKTTDGGSSWTKITSGLPSSGYKRIAMAQDPNSSSIIYAVFQSTNTGAPDYGLKGIFKSSDSGSSWSALTTPPLLTSTNNRSYLGAQGWYDNVIAVDPFNSNNIYVGGVDMMKSTNAGSSWFQLTYWDPFFGSPVVHADHHAIVFDVNNSGTLFSGNDGGIYKTTDGGNTWSDLNNGLEITQFYSGALYPTGSTYYGGTQDNGHLKYSSGTNWNMVEGGDGGYSAQNQIDPDVAYEEYIYLQMERTTDAGANWFSSTNGLTDAGNPNFNLFIAPFAMNPENSNVLIAGSNKIWITGNGTGVWTQSSASLPGDEKFSAVTVVNSSADYLGFGGTTDGRVFKSTDLNPTSGLDTWTDITPNNNNSAWVRRIVVDLNNKNNLYVCYSGYNNSSVGKHVWFSTDQGNSWTDISNNLPDVPVHSLVIDPNNSSTLYIGTETGVFSSTNSGSTWSLFNLGMPSYVPVDELVLQTGTKKLFAFTHGRGVWKTDSPLLVEGLTDIIPEGIVLEQNYPNPFNPSTTIKFRVEKSENAVLKVYDVTGREVITLFNERAEAGKNYEVLFNASSISSGVYYYQLTAGSSISVRKMILLK